MLSSIGRATSSLSAISRSPRSSLAVKAFTMAPANKRKASTTKQFWVTEEYREDKSKGAMLRFEDSLPRLPVPSLEETSARYLKSLHPLLSKEEFAASQKAVAAFNQPGSLGQKLQERLIAKARDPKVKNWIIDWWNEAAYLAYKDPVVPYVSYFYSFRDDRKRRNPAKRAAAITTAALEFKRQVDDQSLEPEYMRKKPMAMSSYEYMFNTSRVPAEPSDYPVQYPAEGNEYIIVIRNNQFFKVPTHVNGKQLNTSEFEQQFNKVYRSAQVSDPIGALTSLPRDQGAKARENLLSASPVNAGVLKEIEASSFVVCLDSATPVTLEERAHAYWHGDGSNRWFDKPLQFIINDNGTAGFMGEHSMMDGTPTHRLCDTVNAYIVHNKLDFDNPSVRSDLSDPTPLKFETNTAVLEDVASAQNQFRQTIAAHDLRVQAYQAYGKGLIKKFKCSPDAYVQMTIQLAYHKMYGKNRPTYESAATRKYQLGRTETTRTVSDESVAFCDAMADASVSREETERLFREAIKAHVQYTADASDGYGVDRHLFGLKKLIQEGEEVPELFKDPAYTYSSSWYISSSQLSSEYFNGYGWSQVIDQGWGIAYMINENNIQFNVVSKKLGCERMSFYLNEAANDIRDLLLPSLEPPKAKL
ncbi:Carnitine O-acetyltransferase mitochondrial [Rhinocladiella similis]